METIDTYIISLNESKKLINDLFLKGFNPILFNGIKYNEEEEYITNINNYWKMFGPKSAIGCGLSHLYVWKKFLKSKKEMCIVFEDDIVYNKDIYNEINNVIKSVPTDFDILYLGSISGSILNTILYSVSNKKKNVNKNISVPELALGTHAYIISKKGAKKIINLKIFQHIDFCLQYLSSKSIIKSYITNPRIVYQTSTNESNSSNCKNKHPIIINDLLSRFYLDINVKASYISSVSCFRIPFIDINLTIISFLFLIFGFIFRKKKLHSLLLLFLIISIPDISENLKYTLLHLILLIISRII